MTTFLPHIRPEGNNNYVAFFLTLACNLRCHYCINTHENEKTTIGLTRRHMRPQDWITAANRLQLRDDLPLTLQGGEPTLYKGFYKIVNEVKEDIKMDLLTNISFDVDEFIRNVPVWRFTREAPYAPIRVSYHPGENNIDNIITKTLKLQDAGFRIGIYGILHPDKKTENHILEVQEKCLNMGIDFRTKEFLGEWNGTVYGDFKYKDSVSSSMFKYCECKITEILAGPGGNIYRCHSDLYSGRIPIAHVMDENFTIGEIDKFRPCKLYGNCNPCDVKIKTNRFQVFDHTSVEIINIWALESKEEVELEPVTQASSL